MRIVFDNIADNKRINIDNDTFNDTAKFTLGKYDSKEIFHEMKETALESYKKYINDADAMIAKFESTDPHAKAIMLMGKNGIPLWSDESNDRCNKKYQPFSLNIDKNTRLSKYLDNNNIGYNNGNFYAIPISGILDAKLGCNCFPKCNKFKTLICIVYDISDILRNNAIYVDSLEMIIK